jgi:hypothetical protein
MSPRRVAVAAGALAVLACLVAVGRMERARAVDRETAGMETLLREVGPNLSPNRIYAYRRTPTLGCLLYATSPKERLAIELCFEPSGRLVEAIDRRGGELRPFTLRSEPDASRTRVPPATLLSALNHADPKRFPNDLSSLPLGIDLGPAVLRQPLTNDPKR